MSEVQVLKIVIDNFECEHDSRLLSITYDSKDILPEIREQIKNNDGNVSWQGADFIWTVGNAEVTFKNPPPVVKELLNSRYCLYLAMMGENGIEECNQVDLPYQEHIKINNVIKSKLGLNKR